MKSLDIEAINEEVVAINTLKLPLRGIELLTNLMKVVFDNLTDESVENYAGISNLHLLSRIYNDLKVLHLLAIKGYSVQAATIACALYEAALTVIVISDNEDKGRKWLVHNKMKVAFTKVKELKQNAIRRLNLSKDDYDHLVEIYEYLSMAKHSNALILTQHSFVSDAENGEKHKYFSYGAELSESSYRLSWYSMLMSIQLGQAALFCFLEKAQDDVISHFN